VLTCVFSSAAFAAQAPTTAQAQAEARVQAQEALSSSQQTSPLTRAQVEHQLAVAQQDGELRYLNTFIYQGS
jgi:TolA-binding protein